MIKSRYVIPRFVIFSSKLPIGDFGRRFDVKRKQRQKNMDDYQGKTVIVPLG